MFRLETGRKTAEPQNPTSSVVTASKPQTPQRKGPCMAWACFGLHADFRFTLGGALAGLVIFFFFRQVKIQNDVWGIFREGIETIV